MMKSVKSVIFYGPLEPNSYSLFYFHLETQQAHSRPVKLGVPIWEQFSPNAPSTLCLHAWDLLT